MFRIQNESQVPVKIKMFTRLIRNIFHNKKVRDAERWRISGKDLIKPLSQETAGHWCKTFWWWRYWSFFQEQRQSSIPVLAEIIESFSGSKSFSHNWQLTRVDHKLASAQKANLLFLRSEHLLLIFRGREIFHKILFINISKIHNNLLISNTSQIGW